jgi:hypothetical protein
MKRLALGCVAAAVLLCAAPASAATVLRLGLGVDYWSDTVNRGEFNITLAVGAIVAPHLQLGGRFGALAVTEPGIFGAPIDFFLRVPLANARVYLEGLVGPWLIFGTGDVLRVHGAFGFGLRAGSVSFGLEVGYCDPAPMAGLRVAFAFF